MDMSMQRDARYIITTTSRTQNADAAQKRQGAKIQRELSNGYLLSIAGSSVLLYEIDSFIPCGSGVFSLS